MSSFSIFKDSTMPALFFAQSGPSCHDKFRAFIQDIVGSMCIGVYDDLASCFAGDGCHMAIGPVVPPAGGDLKCDVVLDRKLRILQCDKPGVGEDIYIFAGAGSMVCAGSDRFNGSLPVNDDDVRTLGFRQSCKIRDLRWGDMGYLDPAQEFYAEKIGRFADLAEC